MSPDFLTVYFTITKVSMSWLKNYYGLILIHRFHGFKKRSSYFWFIIFLHIRRDSKISSYNNYYKYHMTCYHVILILYDMIYSCVILVALHTYNKCHCNAPIVKYRWHSCSGGSLLRREPSVGNQRRTCKWHCSSNSIQYST